MAAGALALVAAACGGAGETEPGAAGTASGQREATVGAAPAESRSATPAATPTPTATPTAPGVTPPRPSPTPTATATPARPAGQAAPTPTTPPPPPDGDADSASAPADAHGHEQAALAYADIPAGRFGTVRPVVPDSLHSPATARPGLQKYPLPQVPGTAAGPAPFRQRRRRHRLRERLGSWHRLEAIAGLNGGGGAGREFDDRPGAARSCQPEPWADAAGDFQDPAVAVEKDGVDCKPHAEHVDGGAGLNPQPLAGLERPAEHEAAKAAPEGIGDADTPGDCFAGALVDQPDSERHGRSVHRAPGAGYGSTANVTAWRMSSSPRQLRPLKVTSMASPRSSTARRPNWPPPGRAPSL